MSDYICELCNFNCYRKDLYFSHKRLHVKYPYRCWLCKNPLYQHFFSRYVEYRLHLRNWHEYIIEEEEEL